MSGSIDISELTSPPEKQEFETAKFFAAMGKNIKFIRPSSIPNQHMPDFSMDGIEWEVKCPEGSSKRTIENNIRKAVTQSRYIIIDLRWIKLPEKLCLSQIEMHFNTKQVIKRILVITKGLQLVEYSRK